MKVLDVLNAPWAILPEKLLEIQNIYATHLRGDKIDLKAIEAQLGRPLNNETKAYENVDGVGVIRVDGVLARRMNLFSKISGGASTELITQQVLAALEDRDARSILLLIDSPGGSVDGTQELAETIYKSRGKKPIVALATGMMASGAYWIGAAADEVLISSDTTVVGSIGVVSTHVDVSRAEDRIGIKTTEITAGKYKRIASQYGPLTQEGRQSMQEMVDDIYTAFVKDVASFRSVQVETVLESMADGRIFIGPKAIAANLVNGFSTVQRVMGDLRDGKKTTGFGLQRSGSAGRKEEVEQMERQQIIAGLTIEDLKPGNPGLAAALVKEGYDAGHSAGKSEGVKEGHDQGISEGHAKGLEEGRKVGADAERKRIADVEEQALPGHEALITQFKQDGQTTGEQAAIKILQAEKSMQTGHLKKIQTDAITPVSQPAVLAIVAPKEAEAKSEAMVREEMANSKCSYKEALNTVSKAHPELFNLK